MLEEVLITASSSEEERDDTILQRGSSEWMGYQTPFKKYTNFLKRSTSTPMTVTQMTPSPIRSPTLENTSPTLIPGPSPASSRSSFLSLKQGYLDSHVSTALFRDPTPSRTRRNQQSFSRSRLSESLLLVDYENPKLPLGMERRRSSASYRKLSLRGSNGNSSPLSSSPDLSSMDSTPDCSPDRNSGGFPRAPSLSQQDLTVSSHQQKSRGRSHLYFWGFLALCISSSLGMVCLTRSVVKLDRVYEVTRPDVPLSAAGLRGQMTSGHWEAKITKHKARKEVDKHRDVNKEKKQAHHHPKTDKYGAQTSPEKLLHSAGRGKERQVQSKENVSAPKMTLPKMHLPPPATLLVGKKFEIQDINMYSLHASNKRRVVTLDPSTMSLDPPRSIKLYPADFTDNTQLYSILDSSDERLSHMEIREPYSDGECVPMQDWQTTFHPSCNGMHEIAMHKMGEDNGNNVNLFGVKGFWRYAWRLDVQNLHEQETLVLKTLK